MEQKNQDWHSEDVKAAVRKRGMTMSSLARKHGLAPATLRNVFRSHWPKGERIVAEFIGEHPQDVWPSRYREVA